MDETQIKCIHCENGIRKNPNLGYAHVLFNGSVIPCPFETREYRTQKLIHQPQDTEDWISTKQSLAKAKKTKTVAKIR